MFVRDAAVYVVFVTNETNNGPVDTDLVWFSFF
jgi:hypothetical protein